MTPSSLLQRQPVLAKPKVYVHRVGAAYARYMDAANEAALADFADVVSDGPTDALRPVNELVQRLQGCSAILSLAGGWSDEITADVLRAVGTVKVICIAHWGGQLLEAARQADILFCEGSNANTLAVAEYTVAAALMGVRRLPGFDRAFKSGSPWAEPRYGAGLLCESTVGLAGLGRIGSVCARHFAALGAKVIAFDPYWTKERAEAIGVTLVSLPELLAKANVVSLHLPVTPETKHMLGTKEFALIRNGTVFINSARSAVCDEQALIDELRAGRFQAYLDVFDTEPLPLDHPFRSLANVFLTPHIAGDNAMMFRRCAREAITTLRDYFAGRGLRDYSQNSHGVLIEARP
jgi:phosphoglycerate dehydrogenase-like enzyme